MGRGKGKHALQEYRSVPGGSIAVCRCGFETAVAPRKDSARLLYNKHRSIDATDDPAQAVWKAEVDDVPDRLREGYDRAVEPSKVAKSRAEFDALRKQIEESIMKKRWTHDLE